ncbi:hypothetical protein [Streptomyces anulatus]|uniref:hypothetical protein n=1 Tax=Streptomyces anulatus TaxID=1892 RepID=UPI003868730E|nr:ATP-binding protein [Streptomyces anulatus]WTE04264.1 ATP-binding protein [Streptomyces anulatus]
MLAESPTTVLGDDVTPLTVSFQATSDVDDLIVQGRTPLGGERHVFIAARRAPKLVPSDLKSVSLIGTFLRMLDKHEDNIASGHWRLALALAAPSQRARELDQLTEYARKQPHADAFQTAVEAHCSRPVRERLQHMEAVVQAATGSMGETDSELSWRLLAALRVVPLQLEGGHQADRTATVRLLHTTPGVRDLTAANALFDKIGHLSDDYAPVGACVDRSMLLRDLGGAPRAAAARILDDCLRRMTDHLDAGLDPMVALTLRVEVGGETFDSSELADRIGQGRHLHLVAPSGFGKTHLLNHVAVALQQRQSFPVVIKAGLYGEDGLETLLDHSLAIYSTARAAELFLGAQALGRPVVLLVDGLNECPANLRSRLVGELNALCLREPVTVVTAAQLPIEAPEPLRGELLRVQAPDTEQRAAILRTHGAADPDEAMYALFTTPFELGIAARLTGELPRDTGRGVLLDAYVRERLADTAHPTEVRDVLRQWALAMDSRLASSIMEGEAERIALRVSSAVAHAAMTSPLVIVERQRVSFVHELYHRLLAAEALVLRTDDNDELVRDLSTPRHADLIEFAVSLATDAGAVRQILAGLPNSGVFKLALQGRLGPLAEEVADAEARRLLADVRRAMAGAAVHFGERHRYTLTVDAYWGAYENAVFEAVGKALYSRPFLDEVVGVLQATDAAFSRATQAEPQEDYETLPYLIGCALQRIALPERGSLPAAALLTAASSWPRDPRRIPSEELIRLAASVESDAYAVGWLACLLVGLANDPDVVRSAPRLAHTCWDSGAYHVRLAVIGMATYVRSAADDATREEMGEFLRGLKPAHLGLSSAVVEAESLYGLVQPVETAKSVSARIHAILAEESNPWAPEFAYGIISSQFEDVIAAPYFEAIEGLTLGTRHRLLALAARYSEPIVDAAWILKELIAADQAVALPAFTYWATRLDATALSMQDEVASHLLGIAGCARHGYPLPPLAGHEGPAGDAWQCYGEILWYLSNTELTDGEVERQCASLWQRLRLDLADAAADPLYWMDLVHDTHAREVYQVIVDRFPDRVRTVLEYALAHRDRRIALEDAWAFKNRDQRFIQMLASVGDAGTVRRLTVLTDDPKLGRDAVMAIRHLGKADAGQSCIRHSPE